MILKFSEVLEIKNGKNQKKVENKNGKYPIYGSGGIIGWANEYLCEKENVIIGRKGSINKPIFVDTPFWNVDTAFGLIANREILDSKYLYYFCLSFDFEKLSTTVTIPSLTKNNLLNIKFNVPSLAKQRKIVKKLDKIQEIIKKYQQELIEFEKLSKSIFEELCGNSNQKNLKKVELKDVCSSIVRGPFGSSLKKEYFIKKGEATYKVYEQKNAIQKNATLGEYYIDFKKYNELKRFKCLPNDVIMSCSGTIGKLFQLPLDAEKGIINQALCKFSLKKEISPIFFLKYMENFVKNLDIKGSGIKNIGSVAYIKTIPFYLPSIEQQNRFTSKIKLIEKSKVEIGAVS